MKKQNTNTHEKKLANFFCSHHPLIQHKLTQLRQSNTAPKEFSALVEEISLLLIYEATQQLPIQNKLVETPLEPYQGACLAAPEIIVIPILRAGLGMLNAFTTLLPNIKVGHIGLQRNPQTLQAELYYCKIPSHQKESHFFICDPMLATGNTTVAAINLLRERQAKHISLISLVAAPEGVQQVHSIYPEIPIYAASLDRELNDVGYILPGLGDAGDRLYGTVHL